MEFRGIRILLHLMKIITTWVVPVKIKFVVAWGTCMEWSEYLTALNFWSCICVPLLNALWRSLTGQSLFHRISRENVVFPFEYGPHLCLDLFEMYFFIVMQFSLITEVFCIIFLSIIWCCQYLAFIVNIFLPSLLFLLMFLGVFGAYASMVMSGRVVPKRCSGA